MGLCVRWCEPVRALVCSQKLQILCKPRDSELLAAHLLEKADLDKNQDLSITEFYSLLNYMYEAIGTSEVLALLTALLFATTSPRADRHWVIIWARCTKVRHTTRPKSIRIL